MRRLLVPFGLAAAFLSPGWCPVAEAAGPAEAITLSQALQRAKAADPVLRSKQAQLAAARGASTDAAAPLQSNPQLTLEAVRRRMPASAAPDSQREWAGGIAQTFEIAGQPGFRRRATTAALEALQLEIEDLRLQQRAEVARRFYRVLALQRRVDLETQAVRLFDGTASIVERRRAAGEDTRLVANVALVEAERARNQLAAVQEQLIEARSLLATPLQLPPDQLPIATGDLDPVAADYSEAALLERSRAQPRLQAMSARELSARARLGLEQAARTPDVTLGLSAGREGPPGARERLTTLSVSVPLPLFRRNATGIGAASAEATQAAVDKQAVERDIPAQIDALWARLDSLRQRVERLQRTVLPTLARNEELSTKSLQAGQIGLLELLLANRQVLDARRDLLDALLDFHTTRLTLEAAAGWPGQP